MAQIRRIGLMAAAAVLSATLAYAQKPVGAYSPLGAPTWVTFGMIASFASDEEIAAAVKQARTRNFKWIVEFGHDVEPSAPVLSVVPAQMERLDRLGLWEHVVAVDWNEEWYERCLNGHFWRYGVPSTVEACSAAVYAWTGAQHAVLRQITEKSVVWVTGMVVPGRLVPPNTDYVAVDYYPQDGQPIDVLAPVVLAAEQYTALPLIIVSRWFRAPAHGGEWDRGGGEPPAAWAEGYAAILARPRWVAMLGFLWNSRPHAGLIGLADLPAYRAAVKSALGVR